MYPSIVRFHSHSHRAGATCTIRNTGLLNTRHCHGLPGTRTSRHPALPTSLPKGKRKTFISLPVFTIHVTSSWPRSTTRRPTVSTPVRWGPAASRFPVTQRPSSTGSYVTSPRSTSNQPYRVTVAGPITGRGSPSVVGGKVTTTADDSFYPPRDPARVMYLNIKQDRSPGGAFNPRPIHADQSVVVETTSGRIRGVKGRAVAKWVFAFLGIPYADAPVDTLRFKRTQPIKPWQVSDHIFCN